MALGRRLHAYYIYINATLCSIFIKERENAKGVNAVNSNDLNVYVRDIVAMFKPLLGLTPAKKSLHYYYVTAQALRSYTYISMFALVVY